MNIYNIFYNHLLKPKVIKLINLLDLRLFENNHFIELCLDSNLGKYIINFIKLDKIKDIDLILKFIRNNCYKDIRVKIELTDDQKENLYLALIKEGFIDEALEIKKKDLTDKDIDLIILNKLIKFEKFQLLKK